jgi:hypothetical protein
MGADVKNIASIAYVNNVGLTSIGLFFGIFICGYITMHERHTHPLLCFVAACGLPGIILALMTAVA